MFRRKIIKETYDKEKVKPVIRGSICTGEKVVGFKDIHNGKFMEVMVIRNNRDLDEFLEKFDILKDEIKTEW